MSMSQEIEAIKDSYEKLQMTVEEICADRDLTPEAVKTALMSCSAKYRRACGAEEEEERELNFSDSELEMVNRRIVEIARNSDNDAIALKACMYVRDDKKGRKDVVNGIRGLQFNVLQFNAMIQNSDRIVQRALETTTGNVPKVINIPEAVPST